ncbi:MAG TPA: nucleotidyltransferase family protein [Chitinophagales bacterium]|nr:nucleotidyltransferase family protein [Chitinophagales bacterium]HMW12126.1 nucleotidyltransferase family protein [Chitinophagales bacterium]HMX59914.1 nucleotidyltransferase family protein [Chitinophagales bacterium]HMZ33538.1 nucleotidyltransferase family protein [Chitinophagales bacterium]HNA37986.1 nucleotidyltransferase family protein [Chitinophagales bacterium]
MLAGGFGTRLSTVVKDVPKPMAPIQGKPFLHYIFKELQHQNIENVVLSVGYLKELIQDYFQDNYLGINIQYAIEHEPLGTGGGIKNAFSFVEDDAFVLNGDTYFDIELSRIKNQECDIVLALKPMFEFDRYGTVELNDENKIISFNEKKYCEHGLINGGVYYFHKSLFDKIDCDEKFSFEKDVLEKHLNDLNIQGKIFDNYFIDIGIPEDYNKAQIDFR